MDVPDDPTFQDVMPILAANCVRCHAYPSIGGAPGDLRLDSYDDVTVDEGDPADPADDISVRGAAAVAAIIPSRVRDPRAPMPPRFPLDEVERETLIAWARGEPPLRDSRPGNQTPLIAIASSAFGPGVITLRYSLEDPDRDLVVGQLRAFGAAGEDHLIAPLSSGRDEVYWDLSGIRAGTYTLSAHVDDGGGWMVLDAGTIEVATP